MSVHERYELRMSRLRQELRARKTSCYLGDVLKRMGVIDERQLSHALEIQTEDGRNKLLGEILVDLGWVDEASIRRAVSIQGSGSETEEKRNGEGGQQAKRRLSCET